MDDIKINPPAEDDSNQPAGDEPKNDSLNSTPKADDSFSLGESQSNILESSDAPMAASEVPTGKALEGMIGAEEGEQAPAPITPSELVSSQAQKNAEDTTEEESIMKAATASEAETQTMGFTGEEDQPKKKFPLWLAILIAAFLIAVVVLAAMYFTEGWPFKGQLAGDDTRGAAGDQLSEEEEGDQFCPEGYYLPAGLVATDTEGRTLGGTSDEGEVTPVSDAITDDSGTADTRTEASGLSSALMGNLGNLMTDNLMEEAPISDMVTESYNDQTDKLVLDGTQDNNTDEMGDVPELDLGEETLIYGSGDSMVYDSSIGLAADSFTDESTDSGATTLNDAMTDYADYEVIQPGTTERADGGDNESLTGIGLSSDAILADDKALEGMGATTTTEEGIKKTDKEDMVINSDFVMDDETATDTTPTADDEDTTPEAEGTTDNNDSETTSLEESTMDGNDSGKFDVSLCRPIITEEITVNTLQCDLIMQLNEDPDAYFLNDATKRTLESTWMDACTPKDEQEIISCEYPKTLSPTSGACECPAGFEPKGEECEIQCEYFQDIVTQLSTGGGDPDTNTDIEIQRTIQYASEFGCDITVPLEEIVTETSICDTLASSMVDAQRAGELRGFQVTAMRYIEELCAPEMNICQEILVKTVINNAVMSASNLAFDANYYTSLNETLKREYYANPDCNNVAERCEEIKRTVDANTSDANTSDGTNDADTSDGILMVDGSSDPSDTLIDTDSDNGDPTNGNNFTDYVSYNVGDTNGDAATTDSESDQSLFTRDQIDELAISTELNAGSVFNDNTEYYGENCIEVPPPTTGDRTPTTTETAPPEDTTGDRQGEEEEANEELVLDAAREEDDLGRGADDDDDLLSPALLEEDEDDGVVLADLGDDDTPTAGGSTFVPPSSSTPSTGSGSAASPSSSFSTPPPSAQPTDTKDTALPPTTVLTPPAPVLHAGAPEVVPPTPQPITPPVITPTIEPEKPADMPPEITPTGPETLIYLLGLALAQLYLFRRKIYAYVKGK